MISVTSSAYPVYNGYECAIVRNYQWNEIQTRNGIQVRRTRPLTEGQYQIGLVDDQRLDGPPEIEGAAADVRHESRGRGDDDVRTIAKHRLLAQQLPPPLAAVPAGGGEDDGFHHVGAVVREVVEHSRDLIAQLPRRDEDPPPHRGAPPVVVAIVAPPAAFGEQDLPCQYLLQHRDGVRERLAAASARPDQQVPPA